MKLLKPLGILYGRIMALRNCLYDRNILKSYSLGARTISVGNLTTGGTGKTPLVAMIAKILIDRGEKPCILTRGYGRRDPKGRVLVSDGASLLVDADKGGDEPVELAQKLGGKAVIISDVDRVAASTWARENFEITAFILDDGFQHRRVKRDLDIVCIDATDPFGNDEVLPAGTLRESIAGLIRSDLIVLTRADQGKDVSIIRERSKEVNRKALILESTTRIERLDLLGTIGQANNSPRNESLSGLFAFAGIGNPASLFSSLKSAGFAVLGEKVFADHHRYTQNDVIELERRALEASAGGFITTAKDGAKLQHLRFTLPCYIAVSETVIDDPEAFRDLVVSS